MHQSEKKGQGEYTISVNVKAELMTMDIEKAGVPQFSLASLKHFLGFSFFPVHEPLSGCWGSEISLTVNEEQVWDHMMKLNSHKSMRPNEMHPRALTKVVAKPATPLNHISKVLSVRQNPL